MRKSIKGREETIKASLTRRPRQTDIARFAGVSVSTVSRVLANEPGISTNVRDQVIRIASELGYHVRPVPTAQPQPQRSVALISVDQATGGLGVFYEGILNGLRGAAARLGGTLMPRLVRSVSLTAELQQTLSETQANGIFLVGIDPPDELCLWLKQADIPTVWVNGNDPTLRFDCVSPANFYGARLATRHLIAAGHRRILHFTMSHRHTIRERVRGFEAAAHDSEDITLRVVQLPASAPASAATCEALEAILASNEGFTAAFCMNDMMAVGAMEAAAKHNLSIPHDFAVIGFDDLPCASMTMPRLTTMRVDREGIGREAYRLMQQRMNNRDDEPSKVELAVQIVEGATVKTSNTPQP